MQGFLQRVEYTSMLFLIEKVNLQLKKIEVGILQTN